MPLIPQQRAMWAKIGKAVFKVKDKSGRLWEVRPRKGKYSVLYNVYKDGTHVHVSASKKRAIELVKRMKHEMVTNFCGMGGE
jgi:hypothetical protein